LANRAELAQPADGLADTPAASQPAADSQLRRRDYDGCAASLRQPAGTPLSATATKSRTLMPDYWQRFHMPETRRMP